MEKQQLPRSIKLKLEQPQIMCSGREKVECYYRGKVVDERVNEIVVEFKSYKEKIKVNFVNGICVTDSWQDLKIIKNGK